MPTRMENECVFIGYKIQVQPWAAVREGSPRGCGAPVMGRQRLRPRDGVRRTWRSTGREKTVGGTRKQQEGWEMGRTETD